MKRSIIFLSLSIMMLGLAPSPVAAQKSTMFWNSGLYARHSAAEVETWERWRGKPADNIVVYPTRSNWSTLLNTWWRSSLPRSFDPARQDLVVSVPLWPSSNSVTYTGSDEQWRTLADHIEASDPDAWVRLGWEMNIGVPWAITNENKDQWTSSFGRAADLMKSAAPNLRIVFNPNRGGDQTCTIPAVNKCTRDVFQRVKDRITAYGVDSYDIYDPLLNYNALDWHMNQYGGLRESAGFAIANGKLFALPEWGVSCNTPGCQWAGHAGGDNYKYILHYMDFLNSIRSYIAFESYFEVPEPWIRSALATNPMGQEAPKWYLQKTREFSIK